MPCPYASSFLSSLASVPRRADRKRSECAPGLTDAGLRPVTPLASRSLRQPVHVPRPAAAAGVSGCHGCCGCSPRASRPRRAHSQPQLRRRQTPPRGPHIPSLCPQPRFAPAAVTSPAVQDPRQPLALTHTARASPRPSGLPPRPPQRFSPDACGITPS